MPEWPATAVRETDRLEIELAATTSELEYTRESLADLELAMEDRGWMALTMQAASEFTREGRRRASALCRILSIQNPLIKRGIAVRTGYVWGDGVQITAADDDVNAVVQAFIDDNAASYTGSQAREEAEKTLGTDGDLFRALPTSPLTGRVQVRTIDPDEIEDVICNPEDRDEPWFYLRQHTTQVIEGGYSGLTRMRKETRRVLYPALGFRPRQRPKSIDGIPVQWDTPVQHIAVNRIDGWSFGIGDAYGAIFWARAYKEFLEDWSKLTKSLSRYAWRVTAGTKGKAGRAASEARRSATTGVPNESQAGATAVTAGSTLEAVPKTGATIDSESGRPLAGMVAAALGIPVTMLLADPGQTGARAVAETLDEPMKHEMQLRRQLHEAADRRLLNYVIDQAVKAPRGPLRGSVRIDEYGREVITLADDADRKIDVDWPTLEKVDVDTITKAITAADDSGKVPPLTIARLFLMALNVKNVDEVLSEMTDDNGNWVDPRVTGGQAAADAFRRGDDPAAVLR